MALIKGRTADELRRLKDKSRKTQAFLSDSKKVQESSIKAEATATQTFKATVVSGGLGSTGGSIAQGPIIVDLLLFGQSALTKKGGVNFT